uniref:PAS fold-3 domain-containing protein n=1 Tax=Timema bartmani TaxID=61472 RepID=A0A7R9ERB1_9NEOP|nr:unnamed protein product [Timema bartmani]
MHPPLGSDMSRQYGDRHTPMAVKCTGVGYWTIIHFILNFVLFSKGQCETDSYRFLAKNGGYVWVLTQATLIYGNRGQKPNSVVCVNFVTR